MYSDLAIVKIEKVHAGSKLEMYVYSNAVVVAAEAVLVVRGRSGLRIERLRASPSSLAHHAERWQLM